MVRMVRSLADRTFQPSPVRHLILRSDSEVLRMQSYQLREAALAALVEVRARHGVVGGELDRVGVCVGVGAVLLVLLQSAEVCVGPQ